METLKTAVIGAGMMGKNHIRIYSELKNSELVGIADINFEKALELSKKYGGNAYKDYREMLKKEKPDAVSVVVPTRLHSKIGCDVLKYSNILVEKPIADTVENAEKLINTAEKNNKVLLVGQIERFNPVVDFFKEWADRKKIHYLSLNAIRVGLPIFRPGIDTGVVLDLAIHDIDIIRYLTGKEVNKIDAFGVKLLKETPGEDHAHIWMRLNGISASIVVNWVSSRKIRKLGIVFNKGYAEIDYIEQKIILYAQYGRPNDKLLWHPERILELKYEEPLKNEIKHFLDCVTYRKKPKIDGKDALESLKVALEAEKIIKRRLL